jgi:hypothetical protein
VVETHNKASPSGPDAGGNKSEKPDEGAPERADGDGEVVGAERGKASSSSLILSGGREGRVKSPLGPQEELEILPIYEDGGKLGFKQGSAVKACFPAFNPTP